MKRIGNEIDEYRGLMTPPEEFHEGFSWKTVVGAFFLGFIMMPATMYLQLFAGAQGAMTDASRWVTIIIFAEIARRMLKDLRQQEVYILYYMAGLTTSMPFKGLLWNQYFAGSDAAIGMGIAEGIPSWWAPSADVIAQAGRTFFTPDWVAPIIFLSLSLLVQRIDNYGLGYVMYRLTNDVEELPFPMAPVGASGIVSLVEKKGSREPWRWRCFSIGGVLGLVFGAVFIGVPAITGAFLAKPLQLLPIPWLDVTREVGSVLPAVPANVMLDLGSFLMGTVMPFWAVVGGIIGLVMVAVMNPVLRACGILDGWDPQMGFVDTMYSNQVDFYLSFGVGLTAAVAFVSMAHSLYQVYRTPRGGARRRTIGEAWRRLVTDNARRGDFSIFIALGIYCLTTAAWIGASIWLIPGFPWPFFLGYAAIYVPIISYTTAKLEGLCGQAVTIPMTREATYVLSGYQGVQVWFAPVPEPYYGSQTEEFKVLELTGTKIMGHIKTQLVTLPIILVAIILFSQLLWRLGPVPSAAYPFAGQMWELQARTACLTMSATTGGESAFREAWNWQYVTAGLGVGSLAYAALSLLGLPTLIVFGVVRGMGLALPGALILQAAGALTARYYLRKRFPMWIKYAPVILAGYTCGMGLVGMLSVSFTILKKMMTPALF